MALIPVDGRFKAVSGDNMNVNGDRPEVHVAPTAPHEGVDCPADVLPAVFAILDHVTCQVARRRGLKRDELDDFVGHVRLKFIENDYAILRKRREMRSLRAYLTTVVDRLLLDYRVAQWGRWRPSVDAQRAGRAAVLLDQLLTRDGLTFNEAYEVLKTNYQLDIDRDELYTLSARLPVRRQRRWVGADFEEMLADGGDPHSSLLRDEASRVATALKVAIRSAIASLPADDRRLIELRYRAGYPVVDIARECGLPAKGLYRRLENIIRTLRRSVMSQVRNWSGSTAEAFQVADISISW
jgi:RNA polymerase sigma factor (sigma-70 family)